MSLHPSWLAYSTLRTLCIFHGVKVQNVSRRTLYNWRASGVEDDHIDLLMHRLVQGGFYWWTDIEDIFLSCGYSPQPYC